MKGGRDQWGKIGGNLSQEKKQPEAEAGKRIQTPKKTKPLQLKTVLINQEFPKELSKVLKEFHGQNNLWPGTRDL